MNEQELLEQINSIRVKVEQLTLDKYNCKYPITVEILDGSIENFNRIIKMLEERYEELIF